MLPTVNVSPGPCEEVNVATPQLSVDVGSVQLTTALQSPAWLVWLKSAGVPAMAGTSSSVTVTSKLEVLTLL